MQSYASLREGVRRLPVPAEGSVPADIQRNQRQGRARVLQQRRGLRHRNRQGLQRGQEGGQDHPGAHLRQPPARRRVLQDRMHAVPRGRRPGDRLLVHRHHTHGPHDGRHPGRRHDHALRGRGLRQAGDGRRLERAGRVHPDHRGGRQGAGRRYPQAEGMPRRGEHPDKANRKEREGRGRSPWIVFSP